MISGIIFVIKSGGCWCDCPPEYGPAKTIYNRLCAGQGDRLKARKNLIIAGQTDTGKTWPACTFARQVARLGRYVLYLQAPRLFEDVAMARHDRRFPRLVDKLARVQLLILDDWGTHSLNDQ